ncbi:MAG: putative membrane protein [Cyclobacteriaceae bacterium]|jgi:uncharacterized membrane protein
MSKTYPPWDRFYQKLNMIFNGIVASSLIPFAIIFLQYQKEPQAPLIQESLVLIVKVVLIILCLGDLLLANWLRPKFIEPVKQETTIEKKLQVYLSQKIKQYALIEGAAMISLLGFYLLQDQFFSFMYVGVLIVFSMHRPTFARVSKEIEVSEDALIDWSQNQDN